MECACIVDENVESPLFAPDLFENRFDLFIVTVISPNGNASAAGVGHRPCGLVDSTWQARIAGLFGAAGHIHRAAMATECDSDAAASSPAGTGDQCDLRIAHEGFVPGLGFSSRCRFSRPRMMKLAS